MSIPIKNLNHKIAQSISQYEESLEKDDPTSALQLNNLLVIDLDKQKIDHPQLNLEQQTQSRSSRRKNKRSQRYLKEKSGKQEEEKSSKVQQERYFSALGKKNRQNLSNQQIPKTIHAQIQMYKDPRIVELAMRYGMYKDRPHKNFNLSIKKRVKNPCPTPKNQSGSSSAQQSSILMHRKHSAHQNYEPTTDNKVSLDTLNVDPEHDKSLLLMLDRKNITKIAKDLSSQNINIELGIIERNKVIVQVPLTKKNKTQRKIQFFVHENLDLELEKIKSKINHNLTDSTHKTEAMQINDMKANKLACNEFKNASQQIHIPLKINSKKHTSFKSIKNPNKSNDINPDKAQIIPASITFKKDKNKNVNVFEKITKSIQFQDKKDIYAQFQTKNDKKQKQATKDQNMQHSSIVPRPKTHKDSRVQKDLTVLRKSRRQLFTVKPSEFTFIFDSKDHPYICQYLVSNGWNQFYSTKLNNIHTLKWVNNPVTSQILNMKQGQFYNHFHKSFQLTSKSFLNANLKANRHFLRTHEFFPDTYDIGNWAERQEFIQDYKYNVMMGLMEKLMIYCFKNHHDPSYIKSSIEDMLLLSEQQDYLKKTQEQKKLQNQFFNAMEFENYRQPNERFRLNIFLATLALKYYQKQRRKHDIDFKECKHNFVAFSKAQFDKNYELLQLYSQQQDVSKSATEIGLYSYNYATPSELLIKLLVREYCFFSRVNNWKYPIESGKNNLSNIWIVKPSSNARGNGIYLEKNMGLMLKSAKDIQSRIVQRYIERPLLFQKTKYPYLNQHKFDLRQWVLLKSLDPLEIYMFSHFYLRLASKKYQTKDIDNNKVHLTNFSANKEFFKSNDYSIVNSDEFLVFLKEQHSIDWQAKLKPRIKEIIIKSIQSCQQKLETPVNGSCFELLGYDILIDQNFVPWLIEVNMSPACQQRTDWLPEYLKNMNEGLLEIVIPDSYFRDRSGKVVRKQYWEKIYHQEYHFMGKDYDSKLQVASVQHYQKQRMQKSDIQSKSKSSLSNSMSPTKFRRKSINRLSENESSLSNFKRQSIAESNQITINNQKYGLNQLSENRESDSFVVNDFVEEEVEERGGSELENDHESMQSEEMINCRNSEENVNSNPNIDDFQ